MLWSKGHEFDAGPFVQEHPGGAEVLEALRGADIGAAFEAVGHSATASRRLCAMRTGGSCEEESTLTLGGEMARKLATREDPLHVHKTAGFALLFYFACLRASGLGLALFPAAAAASVVLAASSLQFRVPRRSSTARPQIHGLFRAHSIIFALRGVTCSLATLYLPTRRAAAARFGAVALALVAADVAQHWLAEPGDGYRTTRATPYWPGASPARVRAHKVFYAWAQIGATWICLYGGTFPTPCANPVAGLLPFDTVLAIQGAAFLGTLVRKNVISSYIWHQLYTVLLLFTVVSWTACRGDSPRRGLFATGLCGLLLAARRLGISKYALWAVPGVVAALDLRGVFVFA
jgi:hypothetical protein